MRLNVLACAAGVAMALSAPSFAQNTIEAGTLTCKGGEGAGLILGSKKTYACVFKPAGGAPEEAYTATVTRIGLDIGVTGKSTMIWTVFAPSTALAARALAGSYAGAAADASLGVGGGAKALVGGSKNSFTLQPLSVQGQSGLNLAVGIAGMSLQ